MMKRAAFWLILGSISLAAACGDDHDHGEASPAEDACEHMIEGPARSITAAADPGADAPEIGDAHTRFDITLPGAGDSRAGRVDLVIAEAGGYMLYMSADVPLTVHDDAGTALAPEASERSVAECTEVALGHGFDLGVGTYSVSLGPTAEALVQVVVVPLGEHVSH
jgi:hypothetical protein